MTFRQHMKKETKPTYLHGTTYRKRMNLEVVYSSWTPSKSDRFVKIIVTLLFNDGFQNMKILFNGLSNPILIYSF